LLLLLLLLLHFSLIPSPQGAGKLPQGTITCDFRERSFDLTAQTTTVDCFRLHVPILLETVLPEKCKIMVKPDKIVVSLKKAKDDFNWYVSAVFCFSFRLDSTSSPSALISASPPRPRDSSGTS
jgi:hypothetical protein